MAKAVAFLELNLTQFDRAIASAQRQLAVLAGAFAGFKTVKFLTTQTSDAIDFANSLWQVSQQMGKMDVGQLLLSQKALEQIGYSATAARTRIQELVGAGLPLATAFGGAGNYAEALTRASEQFGGTAAVLSRSAARFAVTWDRLQAVAGKFREFFLGMSEQFLRPLQVLLDRMIAMDFGGLGERVGTAIAKAATALNGALSNGTIGDILSTALKLGAEYLKNASDYGVAVFEAAALAVGIGVNSLFVSVNWNALGTSLFAPFRSGFATVLEAFARGFNSILGKFISAFASIVDLLPGVGGLASNAESRTGNTDKYLADLFLETRRSISREAGSVLTTDASLLGENFRTAFGEALDKVSAIMGDSPEARNLKARLGDLVSAAGKTGEALNAQALGKPANIGVGKADPFKVITDSLARVGGGGGFIQVGQTLEAKLLIQNNRYAAQTAENTAVLAGAAVQRRPSSIVNQP